MRPHLNWGYSLCQLPCALALAAALTASKCATSARSALTHRMPTQRSRAAVCSHLWPCSFAPAATPRGTSGQHAIVMRPLGNPSSTNGTAHTPANGTHSSNGANGKSSITTSSPNGNKYDANSRSNGVTSTSYSNGSSSSNGAEQNALVLVRRPVSALTAVQSAAAGAAGSLGQQSSREQVAAFIAENAQVIGHAEANSNRCHVTNMKIITLAAGVLHLSPSTQPSIGVPSVSPARPVVEQWQVQPSGSS